MDPLEMTAVAAYLMDSHFPLDVGMADSTVDDELIARCRASEPAAFREVYLRHRSAIYKVASRMIDNEADREEVTQEIFFQVFRSLGNFKGTAKLSTWIHRIAINVVLQHIRKGKSRIRLRLEADLPERMAAKPEATVSSTPEETAIQAERRAAVRRCLASISPKKRAVLLLHDFEGLKAAEVAEIVGASVLTVRTRLFYARRDFYRLLAAEPACADLDLGGKS